MTYAHRRARTGSAQPGNCHTPTRFPVRPSSSREGGRFARSLGLAPRAVPPINASPRRVHWAPEAHSLLVAGCPPAHSTADICHRLVPALGPPQLQQADQIHPFADRKVSAGNEPSALLAAICSLASLSRLDRHVTCHDPCGSRSVVFPSPGGRILPSTRPPRDLVGIPFGFSSAESQNRGGRGLFLIGSVSRCLVI
jgi:hypothetical protein